MSGDWRRLFRWPTLHEVRWAQAVPGRAVARIDAADGLPQLHAWAVDSGPPRQLTDDRRGTGPGWISPDGRWVFYLADSGGEQIGHLVCCSVEGSGRLGLEAQHGPYGLIGIAFDAAATTVVATTVASDGYRLTTASLSDQGPGRLTEVLHVADPISAPHMGSERDWAGVAIEREVAGARRSTATVIELETGSVVAELDKEATIGAAARAPGNRSLLVELDEGPAIWDPQGRSTSAISLQGLEGSLEVVDWSASGRTVLMSCRREGRQQLYACQVATGAASLIELPEGATSVPHMHRFTFRGEREVIGVHEGFNAPSQLLRANGSVRRYRHTDTGPPSVSGSRVSIEFRGARGDAVQAWLTHPPGPGPFPTLLELHGGPHWIHGDAYNAGLHAWLDRGYAILGLNYHGSIGFGGEFRDSILGHPGGLELEDMAAARQALVDRGVADESRIALLGVSYGAFLTLLALGRQPQLWAGGIAHSASCDWGTEYEQTSPALRPALEQWLGGTPTTVPERYASQSPLTYAADVAAPVLIIQGEADTNTPPGPVRRYVHQLRERGADVTIHWYSGGHDRSRLPTAERVRQQELMFAFADRVTA